MKKTGFIVFILVIQLLSVYSCKENGSEITAPGTGEKTALTAAQIIDSMKTGFNLGNTFDLDLHPTTLSSISPIIDFYADAGMKHIRIPVTWTDGFSGDHLADSSGHVNFAHPRFTALKQVIDYALSKDLWVVINMHHEETFKNHYNNTAAQNAMFTTLWTDIALYFKDYSQNLIFEILNEPSGAFGDWSGGISPYDPNGIALTQKIYKIGYDAIRSSHPLNENRVVMISVNAMGNHSMIDEIYPSKEALPGYGNDNYLAIQVHTYDPWDFCGQDGSNSAYPGKASIESSLRAVAAHARTLDIPVNYGEYGVGRRNNQQERNTNTVREFYHTIVRTTLEEGMSSTVWDDRGWFGLIALNNSQEYEFLYNIVPFMLGDKIIFTKRVTRDNQTL